MSFLTGSNVELIYASPAATAAKTTFTSIFNINPTTSTMLTQASLPPNFWLPGQAAVGHGIRIVARGVVSTNTVAATFTFSVSLGAAATTGAPVILGSPAVSVIASASNAVWEFQGDFVVTAVGAAAATTGVGVGTVSCGAFGTAANAGVYIMPLYGASASPGTVATIDTTITNFVNFNVTCGTSATLNSITLQQLLVYGLN